jgi:hypothetical protein
LGQHFSDFYSLKKESTKNGKNGSIINKQEKKIKKGKIK